MPLTLSKPRSLWEDRFSRPSIESLVGGCPKTLQPLIDHARGKLQGVKGVTEQLAWQGIPWRWTLTYGHVDDCERAFAFVVPDPAKPRLAVPFPTKLLTEIPLKKASRFLKDGIASATVVGTVRWCQWEIQTKVSVDEIIALAEAKVAQLAAAR